MKNKSKNLKIEGLEIKKIYFAGIGGIGMSALAFFCLNVGVQVFGGDIKNNSIIEKLVEKGATVKISKELKIPDGVECCVVSGAIDDNDVSIVKYRERGGLILSRGEFLGVVLNKFKNSIAISGSHGKTTTTALAYKVFNYCNESPTLFLGGNFHGENYVEGNSEFCIAEACEYKNAFLSLHPFVSVLLNVDYDHVDCFSSPREIERAFCQFASNTNRRGFVIAEENVAKLLRSSNNSSKIITFGTQENSCDYFADNITQQNGIYSFDLIEKGNKQFRITTSLAGKHVVYSCLAVFAVARLFGLSCRDIALAMRDFDGLERRWQPFSSNFTNVIADYAHHPAEIVNLVATARNLSYKKIYVLFQPHTYSRTKTLLKEFATCFKGVEKVVLLPVYSAREKVLQGGRSEDLLKEVQKYTPATYVPDFLTAKKVLSCATCDDILLVVGAGDVIDFCQPQYLNF